MLIQIKEENDILLMYQMTEPCTKITKHGLQSSFLTVGSHLIKFPHTITHLVTILNLINQFKTNLNQLSKG